MKKRILVFLIAFGLLSFTGCGSKQKAEEAVSEEKAVYEETDKAEKQPEKPDEAEEAEEEEIPEITAEEALSEKEEEQGTSRRIAVYVEGYNEADESVFVDEIEWLTVEDTQRLEALGIDPADLPDGYYINNPYDRLDEYKLTENTKFYIIDYETGESADVSREQWYENVTIGSLNWLRLNGSEVESIEEQYLP